MLAYVSLCIAAALTVLGFVFGYISLDKRSRPALAAMLVSIVLAVALTAIGVIELRNQRRENLAAERRLEELHEQVRKLVSEIGELREGLGTSATENERLRQELIDALKVIRELLERRANDPTPPTTQQAKAADQLTRLVTPQNWNAGSIIVPIRDLAGTRLTENFDVGPFRGGPKNVKVEVLNVRPEDVPLVKFQLKADKSFREDTNRSPVVGHGDVVSVSPPTSADRGYYLATRFAEADVLSRNPNAVVRITLQ